MKLAFITDEVTQSFEEAVAFAKENHLQGLELRSVEDTAIDAVPASTLRAWRKRLDEEHLSVPNLAGSFFKCDATPQAVQPELEKLTRLCDAADILGCDTLRGFAFFAPPEGAVPPAQLAPLFAQPAVLLRSRGKRLLLEADPSVNTTNHAAVAALLALLDPVCFGAIYDPGNDLFDPLNEQPYPAGYEAIRPYLGHVHIKDAVRTGAKEPTCVAPGQGLVDYPALLRRLVHDGYEGWLSLEPHYRKNAVLTAEQMRQPQGSAFSAGGKEAAAESAAALQTLLRSAEKETLL